MAYSDEEIAQLINDETHRGGVTLRNTNQPNTTRDTVIRRKMPTLGYYDNKHYTNHTNGNSSDDEETFEIRDGW